MQIKKSKIKSQRLEISLTYNFSVEISFGGEKLNGSDFSSFSSSCFFNGWSSDEVSSSTRGDATSLIAPLLSDVFDMVLFVPIVVTQASLLLLHVPNVPVEAFVNPFSLVRLTCDGDGETCPSSWLYTVEPQEGGYLYASLTCAVGTCRLNVSESMLIL